MNKLEEMNNSELALLASAFDPTAGREWGREALLEFLTDNVVLIEALQNEHDDSLSGRGTSKLRLKIMKFVNSHWEQVRPLIQCPAKTRDPRACFSCTDLQAIECAELNRAHLEEVKEE